MSVDIERLKVDADYWDEVAPMTGAKYYCPRHRYFLVIHCGCFGSIPRPTKPEWVDGLPPVGEECGMTLSGRMYTRVQITYMGDGVFCYRNLENSMEYTGALRDAHFAPIRTEAEKQREELANDISIAAVKADTVLDLHESDTIADAILSKYNLTEK